MRRTITVTGCLAATFAADVPARAVANLPWPGKPALPDDGTDNVRGGQGAVG